MNTTNKVAVIFDNLGPYHIARLTAAAQFCDLLVIEVVARSAEYAWNRTDGVPFRRKTLFGTTGVSRVTPRKLLQRLALELEAFGPSVVVIPGWYGLDGLGSLRWAQRSGVPVVVMSASQEIDFSRSAIKEWVKRRYINQCDAALVGGHMQAEYLVKLGMERERIFFGYDVVDNSFFANAAEAAKGNAASLREKQNLPGRYFLASARFIAKKNLERLLLAYVRYLKMSVMTGGGFEDAWHLVILGDGEMRPHLEEIIAEEELTRVVHLPGFKQIHDLPVYYGLAECFILPSTTEQWGLVVNEAMASGLPIIVAERCGCAAELVEDGRNGFTFNPFDIEALADRMVRMASEDCDRSKMAEASREIIARWSPETFASSLMSAAYVAINQRRPIHTLLDAATLQTLTWRVRLNYTRG